MTTPGLHEPADLVLQGGGVKGIALAGAVQVLLGRYDIHRVAGTSAGAILASLVAAGYTGDEVREVMESLPYAKVPDAWPPLVGPVAGLALAEGLYRGDVIERWVADRLKEKGVETFAQLRLPPDSGADPHLLANDHGYKLVVTGTDITRGIGLRFPWDYRAAFGLDPDEQSVARAVRMSLSIPLFFVPCKLTDESSGRTSLIVDGGVMTNFPLELFDRQDGRRPRWPTFGVGIIPDLPGGDSTLLPHVPSRLPGPFGLLQATVVTAISGHDQTYLAQPRNAARVMRAKSDGVGVVDFKIDAEARERLVANGTEAASEFLATWNWDDYLDCFFPLTAPVPPARTGADG